MKNTSIKIFVFFLSLFCWGCSNNNGDNGATDTGKSYVHFLQKSISVSGAADGVSYVMIEWSNTEWEITYESGNIVVDVSPMKGGNSEDVKQVSRIKITYNANSTLKSRSQTIHITNKQTGEVSDLLIDQSALYNAASVTLDMNAKYQYVAGFGGMYNPKIWLGGNLITTGEMNKMYGPDGLGYSILRLMIYPNQIDWAADVQGAKIAQQNGALVFACPWDCTDALADKVTLNNAQVKHLKHENYAAYAAHIVDYINYMKNNGVNLYAVSIQNEPDMDFTYWTPAEVVDFLKRFGPTIRATGVKLMTPEACGFQPEYTDPVLNDAEALAQSDIIAGHLYQGFIDVNSGSYVRNRHDYICGLYNSKLSGAGKGGWWMTEHCYTDGENETDSSKWEFRKWDYNLSHFAKEMHMSMDGYCSAYIDWYLKRFYGALGDNDSRSPVPVGEITKCGYILSHYSKYATGRTRIKVTSDNGNVLTTAYINESGSELTLVMLNMANEKLLVQIPVSGVKNINAVETNGEKNMQTGTTGMLDNGEGVYAILSENSITSIRITR